MKLPGEKLDIRAERWVSHRLLPLAAAGSTAWIVYNVWPGLLSEILLYVTEGPFFIALCATYGVILWRNWRNPRLYVVLGLGLAFSIVMALVVIVVYQ